MLHLKEVCACSQQLQEIKGLSEAKVEKLVRSGALLGCHKDMCWEAGGQLTLYDVPRSWMQPKSCAPHTASGPPTNALRRCCLVSRGVLKCCTCAYRPV